MRSIFMIVFVSVFTIASQLLLKKGINDIVARGVSSEDVTQFLRQALLSPYVIGAMALQVASYLVWIFVISKYKLGYAFAISGALFYLLLAFAGWVFFGERLTAAQWAGVGLITAGVVCMNLSIG